MQAQAEPRVKRRIPCEIEDRGARYSGIVLNCSQHGLFVQTRASAAPGSLIDVGLKDRSHRDPIPLSVEVVWKRVMPPDFVAATQGGMGLRIRRGCPAYDEFLAGFLEDRGDSSQPAVDGAGLQVFRVRVKLAGAPRSRSLVVSAATEEEARQQALSEMGEGWVILELEQR